jgi:hypothetical protein
MKKTIVVVFMLICAASFTFAGENQTSSYKIDADLANPGYQGLSYVNGIGGGEKIGFVVYIKDVDELRGLSMHFIWDGEKATKRSDSMEYIESDDVTINGLDIELSDEANILTTDASPLVDVDDAGHYAVTIAKKGGDAVASSDYGLAYYFVLKTSSDFTESDDLTVIVKLAAHNNDNKVIKDLYTNYFYVNQGVSVETKTWGEIKTKFKD